MYSVNMYKTNAQMYQKEEEEEEGRGRQRGNSNSPGFYVLYTFTQIFASSNGTIIRKDFSDFFKLILALLYSPPPTAHYFVATDLKPSH